MQNDFEIMDHEIEDDADVDAAGWIRREPMGLDETGFGCDGFEVFIDRIETFDMPDLENALFLLGKLHDGGRLFCVFGHRLFDEHVASLGDEVPGDVEMRDGGRDDAERVRGGGGFIKGGKDADVVTIGHAPGGFGLDIIDSGEFECADFGQFGVDAGVFLAERSGAENGYANFCGSGRLIELGHGASLPLGDEGWQQRDDFIYELRITICERIAFFRGRLGIVTHRTKHAEIP